MLKLPDVVIAQCRAMNAWFTVLNPSSVSQCELKFRIEGRPDLLAQLSLVQRGSGALVSNLDLSPGERVDLRVILQNKPGCPARGDDVVWGLVEIEVLFSLTLSLILSEADRLFVCLLACCW